MIYLKLILIPNLFCIILKHQFLEIGISDVTLIGLDQLHKFSGFSLYSLSFLFKYDDPIVRFDLLTILLHCKIAQIKINLF